MGNGSSAGGRRARLLVVLSRREAWDEQDARIARQARGCLQAQSARIRSRTAASPLGSNAVSEAGHYAPAPVLLGKNTSRLGVMALATLLLAGCGSSSSKPINREESEKAGERAAKEADARFRRTQTTKPAAIPGKTTEGARPASNDLRTVDGRATRLIAEYQFGPISYGSSAAPPQEVLNSCANGGASIDSDAFAKGTVTFRYVKGTLPLNFYVPSTNAASVPRHTVGSIGVATMESQGQWNCTVENGKQRFTLNPGQTISVPTWIIFEGLRTNAEPELSQSDLNGTFLDLLPEIPEGEKETISGPHAFVCEPGPESNGIAPWATAPPEHCHHGTATNKAAGA